MLVAVSCCCCCCFVVVVVVWGGLKHVIYYCTTGRAIRGNIQFEAGSIGQSTARDNTEAEN